MIIFVSLYSCGPIVEPGTSTIDKFAPFLHLKLNVLPKDHNTILADFSIRNNSKDSILLYKPLLPFDGKIIFPCFSIFNAKTYDQVSFSKSVPRLSIYSDKRIDDAENIPEKYFTLHSGETVVFKVNLPDWYNFRHEKSGEVFKIVPSVSLPYINFSYQQQYEKDSLGGQMKPVFYHLTLPEKNDIDSMRVSFTIP